MIEKASKSLLNAGSGPAHFGRPPAAFTTAEWKEVRLDLDPLAHPDIVGSFADMRGLIGDACFDALY